MAYKYKESIKDAVNEVYSASFADELNRKNELDKVYRKAEAYDKVAKAYEYYMPNDEQQHPMKLVQELNKILISSFRPEDFTMDGFTNRNYNDDLESGDVDT